MSVQRGFNPFAAFTPMAATLRVRTAFCRARTRSCNHGPILSVAVVLIGAALVPVTGRSQESSPPPAQSTDAPKPDANQPASAPAEPSAPAAPAPGSVRVPEVVVTPPKLKRAAQAPRPRAIAAARPPAAAVVQPEAPPPSPSGVAGAPAAGLAESRPAPGALPKPPGQTITTVSGERIKNEPAFTVQDLLQESPGVSFKQGNGPRDLGISIRGSNARNGFGIRNIVVLEDGFSVTQPDGLSRTDLIDPHAYGGVDVYRGPASAMFGNYATGGAINFRLWRGDQIRREIWRRGRQFRIREQLRDHRRAERTGGRHRIHQRRARRWVHQPQLVQHPNFQRARDLFADAR